ncbi:hypothetical protein [Streptomyces sp. MMG1121]|uniref:hypothetical protein n=1 Tax=Streptomyces sp. MMG1121 TaxID=1415544 RepID=UPI0006BF6F7E|nr:hypothetical protein [Streptomyces sp. MMG1121]KOV61491.1 hypothetical protein ADK64_27525 [Streptomyces sp. MMG1121]
MESGDDMKIGSGTELTTEDLARTDPERTAGEPPATYPGEATPVSEGEAAPPEEPPPTAEDDRSEEQEQSLIDPEDARSYRERWEEIQAAFVDDPKDTVRSADALVAEVIKSLAETFAAHKRDIEDQWSRGEEVETEGLRVAVRHYRTFFNQLLQA